MNAFTLFWVTRVRFGVERRDKGNARNARGLSFINIPVCDNGERVVGRGKRGIGRGDKETRRQGDKRTRGIFFVARTPEPVSDGAGHGLWRPCYRKLALRVFASP